MLELPRELEERAWLPLYEDPPKALEPLLLEPRLLDEKSRLPTLELPPRL